MAFPDIPTLLLVTAASNAMVAVFMWLMHRAKPRAGYFHLLSLGAAATAIGWGLYATRLWNWSALIAYAAANLLIVAYPMLLFLAIYRYLGLAHELRARIALQLLWGLLGVGMILAIGDRFSMVLLASGGNALMFGLSMITLIRFGRPYDLARATMLAAVAASTLVLAVRLVMVLTGGFSLSAGDPVFVSISLLIPLLSSFMLAMAFPVGEFRRDEQQLVALAERDALTALPNRTVLQNTLDRHIDTLRTPLAVAFLDLDDFKRINDSLGHATGDALLQAVADRLRNHLQPGELLSRFGGDEFVFLLPAEVTQMEPRARQILECLATPFVMEQRQLHVAASLGLSHFPTDATRPRELLRCADTALFRAKDTARGRAVRYVEQMGKAAEAELALETELRDALQLQRLELRFQPRLSLSSDTCCCAEALIRLRATSGDWIDPSELIRVAERCGLVSRIGEVVLTQAGIALHALRDIHPDFSLSVNLSPLELRDPQIVDRIAHMLRAQDLPPDALELELTETALIEQPQLAEQRLQAIHSLGVHIALDDFGTGYSGLSHLLHYPISVVKIDRSFIGDMRGNAKAHALVVGVTGLARQLGLSVVAEGVEDHGTQQLLAALGCDQAQGFVIAEPMPLPALIQWLRTPPDARIDPSVAAA